MHPIAALTPAAGPTSALLLQAAVASLLSAGILVLARPRERTLRSAFGLFAIAAAMLAVGCLMLLFASASAPGAALLAGSFCLAGAAVPAWRGCARLGGRPPNPAPAFGALALLAMGVLGLGWLGAAPALSQLLAGIWALGFLTLALGTLRRPAAREHAVGLRPARTLLLALCLLLVLRTLALAGSGPTPGLGHPLAGEALGWLDLVSPLVPLLLALAPLAAASARLAPHPARPGAADELTSLVSRRKLVGHAMAMLDELPTGACLAVLMIRLDDLTRAEALNQGASSDRLLLHAGAVLEDQLRENSLVVRYDDDSFCALVPVASEPAAFIVGERLRRRLATTPCPEPDPPMVLGASVSVSVHRTADSLRERLAGPAQRPTAWPARKPDAQAHWKL